MGSGLHPAGPFCLTLLGPTLCQSDINQYLKSDSRKKLNFNYPMSQPIFILISDTTSLSCLENPKWIKIAQYWNTSNNKNSIDM